MTTSMPLDLVVKRRAGLLASVAAAAAVVCAAWVWRYVVVGGLLPILLAGVLALAAVVHAWAWRAARTPLLLADRTGVRMRLGAAWTGIPWELIDRVLVSPRGVLRDGQVALISGHVDELLAEAGRATRLGARLNRRLHDASAVVPFGLTASVSSVDVAASLEHLAEGRTEIVTVAAEPPEPVPTVELMPVNAPAEPRRRRLLAVRPLRSADPTPPQQSPAGPARAVPALAWVPARRAEVTMPLRPQHATMGGLALSEEVEQLPEIESLRREPLADRADTEGASNVSLIIDATTDLSARAMQRVRRTTALSDQGPGGLSGGAHGASTLTVDATDGSGGEPGQATHVGGQVASARHQLGLSLDDLADRTRIRPFVIEAIERDDFSPCGGDFYARGHLRMLARVLGVDAAPFLAAYDEHFATSPVNARDVFEVELASGTTGMVRGAESGTGWGALAAAVLVLLLVWGVARYLTDSPGTTPAQAAPTQNRAGLGSPGVGNPPVAEAQTAHVMLVGVDAGSRIRVIDRYHQSVFAGRLADGKTRKFSGVAPLRVWAQDAGAVRVSVRGHDQGPLGDPGRPAHQTIRAPRDGRTRSGDAPRAGPATKQGARVR